MATHGYYVFNALLTLLALGFVSARTYIRMFRDQRMGFVEWVPVVGAILTIGTCISNMLVLSTLPKLPDPYYDVLVVKYVLASAIIQYAGLYITRAGVCLIHIQLTKGFKIHKFARASLVFIVASGIITEFVIGWFAQQTLTGSHGVVDLSGRWYRHIPYPLSLTCDILLLVLPFPALAKIQDNKVRLIIACVYTLGVVSLTASSVKVAMLFTNGTAPNQGAMLILELSIHMVIACVPGLSGPWIKIYIRKRGTNSGGNTYPKRATHHGIGATDDKGVHTSTSSATMSGSRKGGGGGGGHLSTLSNSINSSVKVTCSSSAVGGPAGPYVKMSEDKEDRKDGGILVVSEIKVGEPVDDGQDLELGQMRPARWKSDPKVTISSGR